MTFHAIAAYLKYRMAAKDRHGIHSPFVYKLIDECLLVCNGKPIDEKLSSYFAAERLIWLNDTAPQQWPTLISSLASGEIVAIPKIHLTKIHSDNWNKLVMHPSIKMSIDLFHYGLLISRNEFKEKQHFVLKYC